MKAKVEIETDGVADEYEMNTTETWYKQQSWTQKPNQTTVSYHDDIVINYSNIGDHGYNDIDTNDIEYNDFISPDIETNDHHKPQEIQNNSILIILCSVIRDSRTLRLFISPEGKMRRTVMRRTMTEGYR